MSALTDLFSAMANKIRSKTGTATTYTPTEMVSDGIDDVYDAGYADATTPITPSNSSPASMTSGTGYKPTANGYAISSYANKTPSDETPASLSSGAIVKMGGAGYAIESYRVINPNDAIPESLYAGEICKVANAGYAIGDVTSVTPSDSTPPSIQIGKIYKSTARGQLILGSNTLTPSDSSPASISNGTFYKAGGAGYAIESNPTSLAPSNSSPASISSGTIYKGNGAGYAIESYNTITPSDTPVYVNGGTIHKINGSGANVGCFIDGLAQRTPSDSYPYPVSVGGNYRIINNGGYLYKTNHSIGKYDTEEDVTGANQFLEIATGLPSIRRFFLRCEGNNGGSYHSYVCWTAADSSNYEGGTFSGAGSVSGIYNVKALNTAVHIYCPTLVSISGGTVTLKTGTNAASAIKNGWWVACS